MNVGQYLKSERELRGISLDQVAEYTKVSKGHLEAIETGQFDSLPGKIFVKGFIKAYAKFIGISPDDAVLRYEELFVVKPAHGPSVPGSKPSLAKGRGLPLPSLPRTWFSGRVVFILIAIAVVVLSIIFSSK